MQKTHWFIAALLTAAAVAAPGFANAKSVKYGCVITNLAPLTYTCTPINRP